MIDFVCALLFFAFGVGTTLHVVGATASATATSLVAVASLDTGLPSSSSGVIVVDLVLAT
jgi:hypothetical protein